MKIKVCNDEGCATVEVIQPGGDGTPDEVTSCVTVEEGQEVELSAEGAVSAGEVTATE